jgi:hypothetical protein
MPSFYNKTLASVGGWVAMAGEDKQISEEVRTLV